MLWGKKKAKVSRGIASVTPTSKVRRTKGKIITIRTIQRSANRIPASAGPMKYYQEFKKSEAWKYKPLKTNTVAPIKYYGDKWMPKKKVSKIIKKTKSVSEKMMPEVRKKDISRFPASVGKAKFIQELKKSDFEQSLETGSQKTKRHSNEVNNLIDELKTYKQDFKKNY